MVLGSQEPGRVGRRRFFSRAAHMGGSSSLWCAARHPGAGPSALAAPAHRRRAHRRPPSHRARPARVRHRAQRPPVRVGAVPAGVIARARDVLERGKGDDQVGGAPEGVAERARPRPGLQGTGEHVFAKLGPAADGPPRPPAAPPDSAWRRGIGRGRLQRLLQTRAQTVEPSDAQTSIFVRTRSTTSVVKPLVVAAPPRSGVRTPAAVASNTAS
jgi:hypothetical protein